jgi:hypothetical protein
LLDAKPFLDFFQCSSLLYSPQAGKDGGKEVEKYQGQILIIVELSVLMIFNVVEPG